MNIITDKYNNQKLNWPQSGKHILAQFNNDSIIVYQAYRSEIGKFASRKKFFGSDFSLNRMSWIKPNFLWMMYRSGWGQKEGQEVVLAVFLKREAFDLILSNAIHSSFNREVYANEQDWKVKISETEIVMQWDPDHDPYGNKQERRAIQLGLRGESLKKYSREWINDIQDISNFVREQYQHVKTEKLSNLVIPAENIYPVSKSSITL